MRDPIERVEIVDPPISELTKRHRSFTRTCFTGCLFIILFIAVAIGGVRFWLGSRPQELTAVPPEFPSDIGLYDKDSIEQITLISAQYRNHSLKLAALSPRLFLAPLLDDSGSSSAPLTASQAAGSFWQILTAPIEDNTNVVRVQWRSMPAEPLFVLSYYKSELLKKSYTIENETTQRGAGNTVDYRFSFSKVSGANGTLAITDDRDNHGTDYAVLTVHTLPATTP